MARKRSQAERDARDLTIRIVRLTDGMPERDAHHIATHLLTASLPIGAKIVGAYGSRHRGIARRNLRISVGSARDLQFWLEIGQRLNALDPAVANDLLARTRKIERTLIELLSELKRK